MIAVIAPIIVLLAFLFGSPCLCRRGGRRLGRLGHNLRLAWLSHGLGRVHEKRADFGSR